MSQNSQFPRNQCLKSLVRRKQVDSEHTKSSSGHQLAKALSVPHLIAIGSDIGICYWRLCSGSRHIPKSENGAVKVV
ncbi:hypothetical protein Ancab_011257 [Ancistrocladus abbreviatus]